MDVAVAVVVAAVVAVAVAAVAAVVVGVGVGVVGMVVAMDGFGRLETTPSCSHRGCCQFWC